VDQTRRSSAKNRRLNIVCIMADDPASQAMSCCGRPINQTPNLDRIARAGRLRVDSGGNGITHVSTWALYGQIRLVSDGANVASIGVSHRVSTALLKVWITLGCVGTVRLVQ